VAAEVVDALETVEVDDEKAELLAVPLARATAASNCSSKSRRL
jgi:hypothetical protein